MIIDITNEILTDLKDELTGVTLLTSYAPTTPKFPTVTVEEMSNSDNMRTKDSGGVQHNDISFIIDIYTTGNKKMSEAKDIRNKINTIISGKYGLARGKSSPIPNYLDASIYRYRLTYTGTISKNKTIYRGGK